MEKQRLSKVLAAAGVASRRACETLIFDGRVSVNGQIALLPQTMVDANKDKIKLDGESIGSKEPKVYYLLNKPAGFVCSNQRFTENTKLVIDLFDDVDRRLFTVGRLDRETTGLLIVTNDGHFANKVIHPSSNISKEYLAKVDKDVTHEHLCAISSGTMVEGTFVKPLSVHKMRRGTLKITIAEGKKREVRVLLEAIGLEVLELTRIRIGNIHLGSLPLGHWRELTKQERDKLTGV